MKSNWQVASDADDLASTMAGSGAPLHPGQLLQTHFLAPRGLSQQSLAKALGISRRRVNELVRGRRGITADTAIRLAAFFGIDAAHWMRLQANWDLHEAAARLRAAETRRAAPRARGTS